MFFANKQLTLFGVPEKQARMAIDWTNIPKINYPDLVNVYGKIKFDFDFEIEPITLDEQIIIIANFVDYLDKNYDDIITMVFNVFNELKQEVVEKIKKEKIEV